ncbi:hypothetical protein AeMF1_004816 [Aphanomyces euteiches]|nr:hypothetical protein AeMF1_004816 [Aphanomyces euteiches]
MKSMGELNVSRMISQMSISIQMPSLYVGVARYAIQMAQISSTGASVMNWMYQVEVIWQDDPSSVLARLVVNERRNLVVEEGTLIPIPLVNVVSLWDFQGIAVQQVWTNFQSQTPDLVNSTVRSYSFSPKDQVTYLQTKYAFTGNFSVYLIGDICTLVNVTVKPKIVAVSYAVVSRSRFQFNISSSTGVVVVVPRAAPIAYTLGLADLGVKGLIRLFSVQQTNVELLVSSAYSGVFRVVFVSNGGFQVPFDLRILPLANVPNLYNISDGITVNASQASTVLSPQSYDNLVIVNAATSNVSTSPLTLAWPQYQPSTSKYFSIATSMENISSPLTVSIAKQIQIMTVNIISQPETALIQLNPLGAISSFSNWTVFSTDLITCNFQVNNPDTTGLQFIRVFFSMDQTIVKSILINSTNISFTGNLVELPAVNTTRIPWSNLTLFTTQGYLGPLQFSMIVRSILVNTTKTIEVAKSWNVTVLPLPSLPRLEVSAIKSTYTEIETVIVNITVGSISSTDVMVLNMTVSPSQALSSTNSTSDPVVKIPLPSLSNQLFPLKLKLYWFGAIEINVTATVQSTVPSPRDTAATVKAIKINILPIAYPPVLLAPLISYGIGNVWSNLSLSDFKPLVSRNISDETVQLSLQSNQAGLQVNSNGLLQNVLPNVPILVQPNAQLRSAGGVYSMTLMAKDSVPSSNSTAVTMVNQTLMVAGISMDSNVTSMVEGQGVQFTIALRSPPQAPVVVNMTCDNMSRFKQSFAVLEINETSSKTLSLSSVRDFVDRGNVTVSCSIKIATKDPYYNLLDAPRTAISIQDPDVSGLRFFGLQVGNGIQLTVAEAVFGDSYSVTLATIPFANVVLSLSCNQSRVGIFPSKLIFTKDNWNIKQSVIINATDDQIKQGTAVTSIVHTVASDDQLYASVNIPPVMLTILETADRTPPPLVQNVYFGNTGADLITTFNRAVDQTNFNESTFRCSMVFNLTNGNIFGIAPTCSWPNTNTIRVVLGKSATILPSDTIGLLGGVLKSSPDSILSMPSTFLSVGLPLVPLTPKVSVVGAVNLGSCDDLYLDAKASSGSGGRAMQWQWGITPSGLLDGLGTINQTIFIPSSSLQSEVNYIVTLTLINFLGINASSGPLIITKAALPLPSIYIQGPSQVFVTKSQGLRLTSVAALPTCGDTAANPSLGINWYINGSQVVSLSKNPRQLRLVQLNYGDYIVSALVFIPETPWVNNSASVYVQVGPSPLIAEIFGGNRSAGNAVDLLLNGTRSTDPDNSSTALLYQWSCSDLNTNLPSCMNVDIADGKISVVPSSALPPLTTILITLTVTDPLTGRQSSASASYVIKLGNPPITTIKALSAAKFNPDTKIILTGNITSSMDPQPTAKWSIDGDTDGSIAALTFGLPTTSYRMVLLANTLKAGRTYVFILTGMDKYNQTSSAQTSVVMNEPPTSGTVTANPQSGSVLSTSFHLSCDNWVDEDLPLQFSFKYIVGDYSPTATQVPLGDFALTTSFDTVFPAGGGKNNTITIVSYIADSYGYSTQALTTVTVTLPKTDAAQTQAFLQNQTSQLANLASSKDPGQVLNLVNILASLLTPTASQTPTASIPPQPVTPPPVTPGPSDPSGSRLPTPAPTKPPKQCPSAVPGSICSGHGSCPLDPPQCSSDNLECSATCNCVNSWYDTDCNTSQEEYDKKQQMLGSLLSSMVIANANIEPTTQALEQQSSAVASITANVAMLSPAQQNQALDLVVNVLSASSSVTLSPATTSAVGLSVSSLLDAPPVTANSTSRRLEEAAAQSAKIGSTVSLLSSSILSDTLPGEAPVQLNTKNLKLTVQRHEPEELAGANVELPLTAEQVRQNYTAPSFAFPSEFSSLGCGNAMDTHAALYSKNLYSSENASAINSAVMGLNLLCANQPLAVSNLTQGIILRMRNNMKFAEPDKPLNGTVECFVNQTTTKNITCDAKNNIFKVVTCNGTADYNISFVCPQIVSTPLCRYWDTKLALWSSEGCEVVPSSDPDYTICNCTHLTDFSTQMGDAFKAVEDNVVAVFNHKTTLEDVKQNLKVVITMAVFFILYASGLVNGRRLDKRDAIKDKEERQRLMEGKKVDATKLFEVPKAAHAKTRLEKLYATLQGFWEGLTGQHQLFSIFFQYNPDFTRPQRLMIIFTTMMSNMLTNAVLYRLRQLTPNIGTIIVSGLVSNIIMLPVTLALVVLFKKSGKKYDYLVRYQMVDGEQEVEFQVDAYGNPVEYTKYDLLRMDLQAVFNKIQLSQFHNCRDLLQHDGMNSMAGSLSQSYFLILHNHEVFDADYRLPNVDSSPVGLEGQDPLNSAIVLKHSTTRKTSQEALALLVKMWEDVDLLGTLSKLEPIHLSPETASKLAFEIHMAEELLKCEEGLTLEPIDYERVSILLDYCQKFHACAECYAQDSAAVLRHARKEIQRAKQELVATKKMLKTQLRSTTPDEPPRRNPIRKISNRKLSASGSHDTISKKVVKEQVKVAVHERKHHVKHAKTMRKQAQRQMKQQQKEETKKTKAEINEVVQTLKGVEKFKKKYMLEQEVKQAKMLQSMPLHTRQVFLKEQEKLKELRMTSRLLYNQFIRKQPQTVPKPIFPNWVNYVVYVMCASIDGFAAWFVLQFSFTVGGDVGDAFISSILVGLLTTWLISQPISIFFKMGIMPVIATSLLINTGIFQSLSTESFALGATAAATVGMAAVVRRRERKAENLPPQLSPDMSQKVQPILGPSSDLIMGGRSSSFIYRPDANTTEYDCECGLIIPKAEKDKHLESECSHRLVQCRAGCGIFLQARASESHEKSRCRLIMCTCGKMLPKQNLRKHQQFECKLQLVVCRFGCGKTLTRTTKDRHEHAECALRPTECPHCNIICSAREIQTHVCQPTMVTGLSR